MNKDSITIRPMRDIGGFTSLLNLKMDIYTDENGIGYKVTSTDGDTFELASLPDSVFIEILKSKGYKITKEF